MTRSPGGAGLPSSPARPGGGPRPAPLGSRLVCPDCGVEISPEHYLRYRRCDDCRREDSSARSDARDAAEIFDAWGRDVVEKIFREKVRQWLAAGLIRLPEGVTPETLPIEWERTAPDLEKAPPSPGGEGPSPSPPGASFEKGRR